MPPRIEATQDLRGWFYAALAPSTAARVLESGESCAQNWLPGVESLDTGAPLAARAAAAYDMVVLHDSLAGYASVAQAAAGALRVLRPRGLLALAGRNRLRRVGAPPEGRAPGAPAPCATTLGYRVAVARAGFADVELYWSPSLSAETSTVVSLHPRSSRAALRASTSAAPVSTRRAILRALAGLGLLAHLQPRLYIIGRKC